MKSGVVEVSIEIFVYEIDVSAMTELNVRRACACGAHGQQHTTIEAGGCSSTQQEWDRCRMTEEPGSDVAKL